MNTAPIANDAAQRPVRQSIVDGAGPPRFQFRRPQNHADFNVTYPFQNIVKHPATILLLGLSLMLSVSADEKESITPLPEKEAIAK